MEQILTLQYNAIDDKWAKIFIDQIFIKLKQVNGLIAITKFQKTLDDVYRVHISFAPQYKIDLMRCLDKLFLLGDYHNKHPEISKRVTNSEIRYYFIDDGLPSESEIDYIHERDSLVKCFIVRQQERIATLEKSVSLLNENLKSQHNSIMSLSSYTDELIGMGGLPRILDKISKEIENLGGPAIFNRSLEEQINLKKH